MAGFRGRGGSDGIDAKLLSQLTAALGVGHGGNVTVVDGAPVEIAKRYVEALYDQEYETAFSLLAPDVEAVTPGGTLRGAEELRARWGKAEYDHLRSEIDGRQFTENNGSVHATTEMIWRWTESGEVAYRTRVDSDLAIREGQIERIEVAIEHLPA